MLHLCSSHVAFTTSQVNPFLSEAGLGQILDFYWGLQEGGWGQSLLGGTSPCSWSLSAGCLADRGTWEREWERPQTCTELLSCLGWWDTRCTYEKGVGGWKYLFGMITPHRSVLWGPRQPPVRHLPSWGGEGGAGLRGGSVLGVPSKFIKTLSKQLRDSTHVFLGAEPTLIYIQVLHSSFLLWYCFWKKKRCETDCFFIYQCSNCCLHSSPGSCVGTAGVGQRRRRQQDQSSLSPTTDTSPKTWASVKLHLTHLIPHGE